MATIVSVASGPCSIFGSLVEVTLQECIDELRGVLREVARNGLLCLEARMVLFSRSFVRKRMIALATTASVTATSFAIAGDPTKSDRPRGVMPIRYVADRADHSEEQPFLSENNAAMNKMMADMAIKPTGDVDRDLVAMMVPHHQGAVDMAKAELKYGQNEQLRRLAREIVAK